MIPKQYHPKQINQKTTCRFEFPQTKEKNTVFWKLLEHFLPLLLGLNSKQI